MHSTCGYAAHSSSISRHLVGHLRTALRRAWLGGVRKPSAFTLPYAHSIPQSAHSFFVQATTVPGLVVPTIHTPNKNHKKFYTNNLLLIKRSTV